MEGTDLVLPMTVLLIPFGLFLAFYILYSLFNLYHLLRFGLEGVPLFLITIVFIGGSVVLIAGTIFALAGYDWSGELSLTDTLNEWSQQNIFKL